LSTTSLAFQGAGLQASRNDFILRCGARQRKLTNSPEDFREKIEAWLQFNRRNTINNPNSDCGIQRSLAVPLVGQFKLLEIGNMDQTCDGSVNSGTVTHQE
jgi:hypothetical protein